MKVKTENYNMNVGMLKQKTLTIFMKNVRVFCFNMSTFFRFGSINLLISMYCSFLGENYQYTGLNLVQRLE